MPPTKPPDMRTFDRTVAQDHALFDACLVRLYDERSNWTTSRMQGDVPITLEHFRYDTQRRLAEHLRQVPELSKQDFSDRRILLQHIAHWFTLLSAKYLHTWQEPTKEMIVAVRTNLHLVTAHRKIVLQDPQKHPLRDHPMKKLDSFSVESGLGSGDYRQECIEYLPAKPPDRDVTAYLVGPNPTNDRCTEHTARVLTAISPFLIELDAGQLQIELRELRTELRRILEGRQLFTDSLRNQLIAAIVADWDKEYFAADSAELFDTIAKEVHASSGIAEILNRTPEEQLTHCFSRPLAGALTADAREQLLRRRPILEYLVREAIERKDDAMLYKCCTTMLEYMEKLNLVFGDVKHLGLLTYATTCENPRTFASILG